MSIYDHYIQYYENKDFFPETSFLISNINFYKDNCLDLTYETELSMKYDTDNEYDLFTLSIMNNENVIEYVPNTRIKEICKNNIINEPLKILNIDHFNGNYSIRVILKKFYDCNRL